MLKRIVRWGVLGAAAFLVVAQLVPYGRDHTNPPGRVEPVWDSAETRALAVRACFACHGNATEWPWYSNVAPMSWLVQRDVAEGRGKLNFSAWDVPQEDADDAAEVVRSGEMPPWTYRILHSSARLSTAEREMLIRGLAATFGDKGSEGDR